MINKENKYWYIYKSYSETVSLHISALWILLSVGADIFSGWLKKMYNKQNVIAQPQCDIFK